MVSVFFSLSTDSEHIIEFFHFRCTVFRVGGGFGAEIIVTYFIGYRIIDNLALFNALTFMVGSTFYPSSELLPYV